VFEAKNIDDAENELSEFNNDASDLAYELAYTRYALAKAESEIERLREIIVEEAIAHCDPNDDSCICQCALCEEARNITERKAVLIGNR